MLRLKRRNIKGGDFNLAERLQLASILRNEEEDDVERCKDIIELLHGVRVPRFVALALSSYIIGLCTDFIGWLQREAEECCSPAEPEALQAGIKDMSEKVGELGCIVAMAEKFGWTFKQVYEMPYLDAFAIWKVEAEQAKFEKRLNIVLQQKMRAKHG